MIKKMMVASSVVLLSCYMLTALAGNRSYGNKKQIYAEVSVGMTSEDWQNFNKLSSWDFAQSSQSGVSFGGLLGVNLYKHLSIEAGGNYLPKAEYTEDKSSYKVEQSMFYVAGRLTAKMSDLMDVYTRMGFSYRHLENSQKGVGAGDLTGPLMGLGMDYRFSRVLLGGLSYTHETGDFTNSHLANLAPNLNLFAITATYRFMS